MRSMTVRMAHCLQRFKAHQVLGDGQTHINCLIYFSETTVLMLLENRGFKAKIINHSSLSNNLNTILHGAASASQILEFLFYNIGPLQSYESSYGT